MTRKSALFCCLAFLPVLPGCLSFPLFKSSAKEGPQKFYDQQNAAAPHPAEPAGGGTPLHSTALAREEPEQVPANLPPGPAPDGGALLIHPIDLGPPPPREPDEPKPRSKGPSGIALLNQGPAWTEPKNAVYQAAPPADAKKFAPFSLAMQCLFEERHPEAIQHLRAYDEATQEFFMRIGPMLALVAKKSIVNMSAQEIAVLKVQVKGLDESLRTRCELLVTKMVFCKRISGFADYTPLPANHAFLAKTDNRPGDQVQLYVELKNFASKQIKEGDYLTKLACSLELKDMHGQKVWSHTFDKAETTHRKSACVNDYHGNYSFYVPALPTGTYQLTIQIVDETIPEHRRVARESLAFRVTPVTNQLAP